MNRMNRNTTQKKKWPKYCLIAAVTLLVFALSIFLYHCYSLRSEFGYAEDFYGDTFDEIYSLNEVDDFFEPLKKEALEAMTSVGGEEAYGVFGRYCVDSGEAAEVRATIDALVTSTSGSKGYVWVAYTQCVYDENGNILIQNGTKDARRISRWSVEKIDGTWTVTDISEP